MATEPINALINAIKENNSDSIDFAEDIILKKITDSAKEPLFYSLPFEQISNIIQKVDFANDDKIQDPLLLLQTLIEKTSEKYDK